jgi:hypothetical protein
VTRSESAQAALTKFLSRLTRAGGSTEDLLLSATFVLSVGLALAPFLASATKQFRGNHIADVSTVAEPRAWAST